MPSVFHDPVTFITFLVAAVAGPLLTWLYNRRRQRLAEVSQQSRDYGNIVSDAVKLKKEFQDDYERLRRRLADQEEQLATLRIRVVALETENAQQKLQLHTLQTENAQLKQQLQIAGIASTDAGDSAGALDIGAPAPATQPLTPRARRPASKKKAAQATSPSTPKRTRSKPAAASSGPELGRPVLVKPPRQRRQSAE